MKRIIVIIFVSHINIFGVSADKISMSEETAASNDAFNDKLAEKMTYLDHIARKITKLKSDEVPDESLKHEMEYVNSIVQPAIEKAKDEPAENLAAALARNILDQFVKELKEQGGQAPDLDEVFNRMHNMNRRISYFPKSTNLDSAGLESRRNIDNRENAKVQDNFSNSNPEKSTFESPQITEESSNKTEILVSVSEKTVVDNTTKVDENVQANKNTTNRNKTEIPDFKSEKVAKHE